MGSPRRKTRKIMIFDTPYQKNSRFKEAALRSIYPQKTIGIAEHFTCTALCSFHSFAVTIGSEEIAILNCIQNLVTDLPYAGVESARIFCNS